MEIFITGGSGFVGTALSEFLLKNGHRITAVGTSSNHPLSDHDNFTYISSDTTRTGDWQESLKNTDVAINLAGKNIFKPWSKAYKSQIYSSRIKTTHNIVDALPENNEVILLSTSAAGYYGNRYDELLQEESSHGHDFLSTVCVDWENEALKAEKKGARVVLMRFGVVLGKNGGALSKMLPAFKLFAGGPLGSGKQWFPWIHMDDLLAAIIFIIDHTDIKGPVNFCSFIPARNRDFARALGKALGRPSFLTVPSFLIKLVMGELGQTLLSSQKVLPDKLVSNGFKFKYPDISDSLAELYK